MVDRQAEPDPEEVGFSERLRVRSLDPFPWSQSPLLHESSVDPDQVPQRLVLSVVCADDRRWVITGTRGHHDFVRRSRVGMCRHGECKEHADTEQQQTFHDPSPSEWSSLVLILHPSQRISWSVTLYLPVPG